MTMVTLIDDSNFHGLFCLKKMGNDLSELKKNHWEQIEEKKQNLNKKKYKKFWKRWKKHQKTFSRG